MNAADVMIVRGLLLWLKSDRFRISWNTHSQQELAVIGVFCFLFFLWNSLAMYILYVFLFNFSFFHFFHLFLFGSLFCFNTTKCKYREWKKIKRCVACTWSYTFRCLVSVSVYIAPNNKPLTAKINKLTGFLSSQIWFCNKEILWCAHFDWHTTVFFLFIL